MAFEAAPLDHEEAWRGADIMTLWIIYLALPTAPPSADITRYLFAPYMTASECTSALKDVMTMAHGTYPRANGETLRCVKVKAP